MFTSKKNNSPGLKGGDKLSCEKCAKPENSETSSPEMKVKKSVNLDVKSEKWHFF